MFTAEQHLYFLLGKPKLLLCISFLGPASLSTCLCYLLYSYCAPGNEDVMREGD